jgi:hypothetical protein
MSAVVGPDEPFSHSLAITSWRSEVRTVPPFSDSSGPVISLLPEDNGCEGHNFFQEEITILEGTFCHAYVRLKTMSLRFVHFRHHHFGLLHCTEGYFCIVTSQTA